MQNFERRIVRLITHLSTDDLRTLTAVSLGCLLEREAVEKQNLLLENQDLYYKNQCRMEALEDYGIPDPFILQPERQELSL